MAWLRFVASHKNLLKNIENPSLIGRVFLFERAGLVVSFRLDPCIYFIDLLSFCSPCKFIHDMRAGGKSHILKDQALIAQVLQFCLEAYDDVFPGSDWY